MSHVPNLEVNDGTTIPQLGFGVFQIDPGETAEAVRKALDIGYRHIDTAQMYENEEGVGQGIRDAGVARGDVYVTSKLNNGFHQPDDARRAFDGTLSSARLRLRRPFPDSLAAADALRRRLRLDLADARGVQADGRARSIGVSNFQVAHLERLAKETDTVPAVNQIEVHPYFPNDEVRAYGRKHAIVTEAWSPIAQGRVLDDPVVMTLPRGRQVTRPGRVALAHPTR